MFFNYYYVYFVMKLVRRQALLQYKTNSTKKQKQNLNRNKKLKKTYLQSM